MRFKNYYNSHLRSLISSKFYLRNNKKYLVSSPMLLSLGLKKIKQVPVLGYIFLFLVVHILPGFFIPFKVSQNKKKLDLSGISLILNSSFFLLLLEKLTSVYLPNYENWVGVKDNFFLAKQTKNIYFFRIINFSIFTELDFLLNFNYSSL